MQFFFLFQNPCNTHKRNKSMDLSTNFRVLNDETITGHRTTINVNGSSLSLNCCQKSAHLDVNISDAIDVEGDGIESAKMDKEVPAEIDESNVDFSLNREQWQRRANSQSHIKIPHTLKANLANRNAETWIQRQNHTPDLVMDLPLLVGNSSPKETSKKSISVSANLYADNSSSEDDGCSIKVIEPTGPESPDMTTAAERFAKQNQCTLKKNIKVHIDSTGKTELTKPIATDLVAITSPTPDRKYATVTNASTTTFKPQIKTKPPVLKKPLFSVPLPAPMPGDRKDTGDLPI